MHWLSQHKNYHRLYNLKYLLTGLQFCLTGFSAMVTGTSIRGLASLSSHLQALRKRPHQAHSCCWLNSSLLRPETETPFSLFVVSPPPALSSLGLATFLGTWLVCLQSYSNGTSNTLTFLLPIWPLFHFPSLIPGHIIVTPIFPFLSRRILEMESVLYQTREEMYIDLSPFNNYNMTVFTAYLL